MNIDKRQQNILLMSGIVLGAILAFWILIYSPKHSQMTKLKAELSNTEKEIENIQKMTSGKEGLDTLIIKYSNKLKEYELKLPDKEEATLRELAVQADKMGIKVISISPQYKVDSKSQVNVEGCKCKEMKISMELTASYKSLGEYLGFLQGGFPSLIRINEIKLKKEGEERDSSKLSVSLNVTLYMLVPA